MDALKPTEESAFLRHLHEEQAASEAAREKELHPDAAQEVKVEHDTEPIDREIDEVPTIAPKDAATPTEGLAPVIDIKTGKPLDTAELSERKAAQAAEKAPETPSTRLLNRLLSPLQAGSEAEYMEDVIRIAGGDAEPEAKDLAA